MNPLQIFLFILSSTFIWWVAFNPRVSFVNRLLICALTVVAMRSFVLN